MEPACKILMLMWSSEPLVSSDCSKAGGPIAMHHNYSEKGPPVQSDPLLPAASQDETGAGFKLFSSSYGPESLSYLILCSPYRLIFFRGPQIRPSVYYAMLYKTILYYTILYYSIVYYTILYYTILYYTILYYTILYYTILYYTILYYTILYYTILYYTILYYTMLY